MSGGSKKPDLPGAQAPAARPETIEEVDEAKRKVRTRATRRTGRQSQVFAGQLQNRRILENEQLKQILGPS
jgi:hypothetical protein